MEPGQQQQKGGNKSVFPFFLSRLGNRILQCRKELCATADGKREKLPVRCFGELLLLLRRGGANGEEAPRFGADVCLIMAASQQRREATQ